MKLHKIASLIFNVLPRLRNRDVYFIFPFHHLGGAETVHLDIMNLFRETNAVCLLTNKSVNDLNRNAFREAAETIDLYPIIRRSKERKIALALIARQINRSRSATMFGCNSHFFYDPIPLLNQNVRIIDLIHAFSPEEPYAAEKYSLPYVERIDARVILGKKTLSDFAALYAANGIPEQFVNKIRIIRNRVTIPESTHKNFSEPLRILYVGRDGYEKRPELFFEIAAQCSVRALDAQFFVIGFSTTRQVSSNVTIMGELEKPALDEYYKRAHLLLITSSREGFPMVVLEGMSFGVVPICTDVGEIPDFINDSNKNGFLVPGNADVNAIVGRFIDLIERLNADRSLLAERAANAKMSVAAEFGEENFRKSYLNLFSR